MRESFININFHGTSLRLIEQAISIIDDLRAQGYTLTLRQLYYQFVRRNWLANKEQNYKRLGEVISNARLAGMIDWEAIEDRTRFLRRIADYRSPVHFLQKTISQYAEDIWASQGNYVEVWIEKDALLGVIENTCDRWRVPYFSCRGYTSQSELYNAGERLGGIAEAGYEVTVLHLGDHDPSGIDMTRDISERLDMFSRGRVSVERIALNMDQVELYNPPPNPAKQTDSRHASYVELYGPESWELDALEPATINELLNTRIQELVDVDQFNADMADEQANRAELSNIVNHYDGIMRHLKPGIRPIN